MFRVTSSDGVAVAVHELGGDVDAPPLLISHATGFHAHCYEAVARGLADRFHVLGHDHRGHGATAAPPGAVVWSPFGDDTAAVTDAIAPGGGVVGVGHSMGGASLLMAASRRPERFSRLILFEPIAIPPGADPGSDAPIDMAEHPIVVGARKRRRRFDSVDDAIENFSEKPPLSVMLPEVLRAYVTHGFHPVDGGIELACAPEFEAAVFVTARHNGVWELLPDVTVPVTVVAGRFEDAQPSGRCRAIAERLPDGELVELPHQSHLGPFSHPDELAEIVLARTAS